MNVDQVERAANLARLNRIEGRIRGIAQMVESDRYCVSHAAKRGDKALEPASDESIELLDKNAR